jgi:hypothetical protein
MRACRTGNLEISKIMTGAIAHWVHLGFAAGYQGVGDKRLTAKGEEVARITVLRSNWRVARLVDHCLERNIVKPTTVLVPLSGLSSFVASPAFSLGGAGGVVIFDTAQWPLVR